MLCWLAPVSEIMPPTGISSNVPVHYVTQTAAIHKITNKPADAAAVIGCKTKTLQSASLPAISTLAASLTLIPPHVCGQVHWHFATTNMSSASEHVLDARESSVRVREGWKSNRMPQSPREGGGPTASANHKLPTSTGGNQRAERHSNIIVIYNKKRKTKCWRQQS